MFTEYSNIGKTSVIDTQNELELRWERALQEWVKINVDKPIKPGWKGKLACLAIINVTTTASALKRYSADLFTVGNSHLFAVENSDLFDPAEYLELEYPELGELECLGNSDLFAVENSYLFDPAEYLELEA